jgi:hypothetical protein
MPSTIHGEYDAGDVLRADQEHDRVRDVGRVTQALQGRGGHEAALRLLGPAWRGQHRARRHRVDAQARRQLLR